MKDERESKEEPNDRGGVHTVDLDECARKVGMRGVAIVDRLHLIDAKVHPSAPLREREDDAEAVSEEP